jgi:hypothetical protein
MTLKAKPVLEDGRQIGEARTRAEVAELLTTLGRTAREAAEAVRAHCVESPRAFSLVTPEEIEELLEQLRSVHADLAVSCA